MERRHGSGHRWVVAGRSAIVIAVLIGMPVLAIPSILTHVTPFHAPVPQAQSAVDPQASVDTTWILRDASERPASDEGEAAVVGEVGPKPSFDAEPWSLPSVWREALETLGARNIHVSVPHETGGRFRFACTVQLPGTALERPFEAEHPSAVEALAELVDQIGRWRDAQRDRQRLPTRWTGRP